MTNVDLAVSQMSETSGNIRVTWGFTLLLASPEVNR
jgi:hypothetical protein